MIMPAPNILLVQPQFVFALFDDGLDRPAPGWKRAKVLTDVRGDALLR